MDDDKTFSKGKPGFHVGHGYEQTTTMLPSSAHPVSLGLVDKKNAVHKGETELC